jgi:hypothetical protein
MRQLLREPLVQFLLIGLLLFLLHGWVAPLDEASKRIVVSQARVDDMAREYRAQLGRSPTQEQLAGLVDTYVHDEILYREGVAQGLGRDDPVIRRRVLQKYEIILEEAGAQAAPTDADLAAYLNAHRTDFARPATVTFDQVFFNTLGSSAEVERAFDAARRAAVRGADPTTLGQDSLLPRHVEAASAERIAQDFGPTFVKGLTEAPIGQWIGPLPSSYGAHLVRVTARAPPSLPPLDAVRGIVAREWEADRRQRALAANYDKLRSDYDVAVKARLAPQLASRE